MKQLGNIVLRGWRALTRHQEWNIGIVQAPRSAFLDDGFVPEIIWFEAPQRGRFIADPFLFEHAGVPYIVFEDFDIGIERGHIAVARVTPGGVPEACGPILNLDTHLAYPFIFEWKEATYCVPESADENEIALYRLSRIPGEMEKVCTLVPNVRAIDPTVFEFDGRWWLAFTDKETGSNDTLFLYYATSPLGPWQPHRKNPVKSDIASSRPAGTPFVSDEELYRPAQDCSQTYGGRIALNRIVALTPNEFVEETVRWIEPDGSSIWKDGIHTISGFGDLTVLDGKRERFIRSAATAAIRRNLKKIFRRNRQQPYRGSDAPKLDRNMKVPT